MIQESNWISSFFNKCIIYKAAKRQNKESQKYDCPENYSDHLKSMETEEIIQLVVEA